jgi:hypothetical protein
MNTETESTSNGATPPVTEVKTEAKSEAKPKKEKAPKKPKAEKKAASAPKAKKPAKAKKAKPAKKVKAAAAPKAKKPKAKLAGGKLHNYPSAESTPSERKAAAERTATFMKATAKREEPNADEAKVWKSIKVGSETDTTKMAELFSGASAKRRSRVRNALRWLRASKKFKAIKGQKGHYERVE